MKRVFLDTNILIDYIQDREGGDDAKQLLLRGRDGEVELYASFLTFANIAYILNGKVDIYELFAMLTSIITVLPMDDDQLQNALAQRVRDLKKTDRPSPSANSCESAACGEGFPTAYNSFWETNYHN